MVHLVHFILHTRYKFFQSRRERKRSSRLLVLIKAKPMGNRLFSSADGASCLRDGFVGQALSQRGFLRVGSCLLVLAFFLPGRRTPVTGEIGHRIYEHTKPEQCSPRHEKRRQMGAFVGAPIYHACFVCRMLVAILPGILRHAGGCRDEPGIPAAFCWRAGHSRFRGRPLPGGPPGLAAKLAFVLPPPGALVLCPGDRLAGPSIPLVPGFAELRACPSRGACYKPVCLQRGFLSPWRGLGDCFVLRRAGPYWAPWSSRGCLLILASIYPGLLLGSRVASPVMVRCSNRVISPPSIYLHLGLGGRLSQPCRFFGFLLPCGGLGSPLQKRYKSSFFGELPPTRSAFGFRRVLDAKKAPLLAAGYIPISGPALFSDNSRSRLLMKFSAIFLNSFQKTGSCFALGISNSVSKPKPYP